AKITNLLRDGDAPTLPPIVPVPRDGRPFPLSLNQEHLWHVNQMMPGTHYFNMPYVYRLSGNLDLQALPRALMEIIRRHEVLRAGFQEIDGRTVQIIKNEQDFNVEIIDFRGRVLNKASQAAAEQIVQERWAPFDLVSGPLCRLKLLRLTETEALLLV